jgi:hypothetical protein
MVVLAIPYSATGFPFWDLRSVSRRETWGTPHHISRGNPQGPLWPYYWSSSPTPPSGFLFTGYSYSIPLPTLTSISLPAVIDGGFVGGQRLNEGVVAPRTCELHEQVERVPFGRVPCRRAQLGT